MLLGALVADAACLGTHWIYEPERIAEIAMRQDGQAAFTKLDAANYADVKSYFAHGARHNGMLTQYGEVLRLAMHSINANNATFDIASHQDAFVAHFGAGGSYTGYIDRPMRLALDNMAAERLPSGSDDDQLPAIARLPAILAAYHDKENLSEMITTSMQVTNINDTAAAYSALFADLLLRVMKDEPLSDALVAATASADTSIKPDLVAALSHEDSNSTDFAGRKGMMGRACHLPDAGPVMFHILKHSDSYRDAIERKIRAGGDSAGRAILIGAIMGCRYGVATQNGIPLSWVCQLEDAAKIWEDCERLGNA